MTLLRVETRTLTPDAEGYPQVAVTISEKGKDDVHNTVRPPQMYDPEGIDAHEACIARTITRATFMRIKSFYKVGETENGFAFTIFLDAEEDETKE